MGNAKAVHTFTYTPDAGEAVAVLGTSEAAYGETWHVSTSKEPMTGEKFVRLACELAGRPYKLPVAPSWMLALMSVFIPLLRANREMMYQFEHDYRFDSTKSRRATGAWRRRIVRVSVRPSGTPQIRSPRPKPKSRKWS